MSEDKKPITDVEQPGTSAPSATSKPVLVSNRPLLKDPMMVDDDKAGKKADKPEAAAGEAAEKAPEKPALSTSSKVTLKPPDPPPAEDAKSDEAKSKTGAKPAATLPTEAEAAQETEQKAAASEANQPHKKQAEEAAAAEAQLKHQAAVQKLIDSKQYVLPIHTIEQRRSRQTLIIGVVIAIVLVLAWGDIAADAGLIHVGIKPITHFFSN